MRKVKHGDSEISRRNRHYPGIGWHVSFKRIVLVLNLQKLRALEGLNLKILTSVVCVKWEVCVIWVSESKKIGPVN